MVLQSSSELSWTALVIQTKVNLLCCTWNTRFFQAHWYRSYALVCKNLNEWPLKMLFKMPGSSLAKAVLLFSCKACSFDLCLAQNCSCQRYFFPRTRCGFSLCVGKEVSYCSGNCWAIGQPCTATELGNAARGHLATTELHSLRDGGQNMNISSLKKELIVFFSGKLLTNKLYIFYIKVVHHTLVSSFFHNISCSASLSSSAGSYV